MTLARKVPQYVHDLAPLDLQPHRLDLVFLRLGAVIFLDDIVVADKVDLGGVCDPADENGRRTAGRIGVLGFLEVDRKEVPGYDVGQEEVVIPVAVLCWKKTSNNKYSCLTEAQHQRRRALPESPTAAPTTA